MASVYEIVTEQVVKALEEGVVPWRKPWSGGHRAPMNISGREYRGINVFLLGMAGYESPYWITYRQAMDRGGHVKKGERGRIVVLWRWLEDKLTGEEKPSIRFYTVFNAAAQCEGIEVPAAPVRAFAPIEAAERIVAGVPEGFARVRHGLSGACYVPDLDEIRLPEPESFVSAEAYYQTRFHESVHASGAAGRLARRGVVERTRFAEVACSEGEPTAEMGSAFLANERGILPATLENSAAYLRSWVKVLKGDARLVVRAAGAAQKAADWLTGRKPETDAKTTDTTTAPAEVSQ